MFLHYETEIDPKYLEQLNGLYDNWVESINWTKTMIIDTNNFNIYKDQEKLDKILDEIGAII